MNFKKNQCKYVSFVLDLDCQDSEERLVKENSQDSEKQMTNDDDSRASGGLESQIASNELEEEAPLTSISTSVADKNENGNIELNTLRLT